MSLLGGFLLPPPVGISKDDEKVWLRLAQFAVAVLFGLMFTAARKWNKKKHARWWVWTSATLLLFSVAAMVWFQYISYSWTCRYNGKSVIIGTTYTIQGKYYVDRNPGISCEDLLEDFAGKPEDIWTRESINRHRIILAGTYISCVPLIAICIIGVVQALHITEKRKAESRTVRGARV